MALYGFEVKYWDMNGNLCCVEVIANNWREAECLVDRLETTSSIDGSVLLTVNPTAEHGIKENTRLILREVDPE